MKEALQDVNTKIWKEWLPGNPDFEFPGHVNIEWYGDGDRKRDRNGKYIIDRTE